MGRAWVGTWVAPDSAWHHCPSMARALQWVALSSPESWLTEVLPSGMPVLVFPPCCFPPFPSPVQEHPQSSSESCSEPGGAQLLSLLVLTSCSFTVTPNSQFRRQHPVWLVLGLVQRGTEHSLNSGKIRAGIPMVVSTSGQWSAVHSGLLGACRVHHSSASVSVPLSFPLLQEKAFWEVWRCLGLPGSTTGSVSGPAKASWQCVPTQPWGEGHRVAVPLVTPWAQGQTPLPFSLCVSVSSIKLLFSLVLTGEMRFQLDSPILITLSFIQNECPSLEFRGVLAPFWDHTSHI